MNGIKISRNGTTLADAGCAAFLALSVFLSRFLTRGQLYFVDGPAIARSVRSGLFVVQPPGYWLYAHCGAFFRDPARGLIFWNEIFSALGAATFFFLCRKLGLSTSRSLLSALAYSTIFFVWFAGDIHSSYASQILFAPLIVYCFLSYKTHPSSLLLILCSAAIAAGAGFRPSDGVLLGGLTLFLVFKCVSRPASRVWVVALALALCMAWYIPTRLALSTANLGSTKSELALSMHDVSPLVVGITSRSIANIVRVVLPMVAAFWMILPFVFMAKTREEIWLVGLWIIPGLLFFLLAYMADATYLTFLAGGVVLGAALCGNRRSAPIALFLCFAFNTGLFLGARPVNGNTSLARAFNFYVVKCCNYGIQHQWSSTVGSGGPVPR